MLPVRSSMMTTSAGALNPQESVGARRHLGPDKIPTSGTDPALTATLIGPASVMTPV